MNLVQQAAGAGIEAGEHTGAALGDPRRARSDGKGARG
jgi:hypothetical protein